MATKTTTATKPKPKYHSEETQMIAQVIAFLETKGVDCWRQQNTGAFSKNTALTLLRTAYFTLLKNGYNSEAQINKMLESAINRSWRKVENARRGVPDILGFYQNTGKFIGVEIKIGLDNMSDEQITFQNRLKHANGEFFVVRDYPQFVREYTHYKNLYP